MSVDWILLKVLTSGVMKGEQPPRPQDQRAQNCAKLVHTIKRCNMNN